MTKEEVLSGIANLLEVDVKSLSDASDLADFEEWNSLGKIAFIAYVDEKFSMVVNPKDLADARTIGDLIALVREKIG